MNPEPLDPRQIERFRSMAPAKKWEIAKSLLETARRTRRAAIALRHRDWTSGLVERELAREFASART